METSYTITKTNILHQWFSNFSYARRGKNNTQLSEKRHSIHLALYITNVIITAISTHIYLQLKNQRIYVINNKEVYNTPHLTSPIKITYEEISKKKKFIHFQHIGHKN